MHEHAVHEAMNTGLKKKISSSPFNSLQNQTFSPIKRQVEQGLSSTSDHSAMNNMFIHEILWNVSFTINDHSQGYEHWSLWIYDHWSYWFMHACAIHAMPGYWSCLKNVDLGYEQASIMHDNVPIHVIIVIPTSNIPIHIWSKATNNPWGKGATCCVHLCDSPAI